MKLNQELHSHLKLKKYKTPFNSFIGAHYIDPKICDGLLKFFKSNWKKAGPGLLNNKNKSKIDKNKKESIELSISETNFNSPFKEYRQALQFCLEEYVNTYSYAADCAHYNVNCHYNLQYYPPGGGFKIWHHESTNKATALRKLVFMTYLNNVPKGGTEFKYQKLTTPSEKGLTVIWPAEFTHTHRGEVSKDKEKYIVTGWYMYG
tara:strand:- start:454 stop:1068 length:615 start_codon:yes stop_codon:yes gene_type:complete